MPHDEFFESLEKRQLLSAAPAAPTDLKVAASSSKALTLQWADNAGNESGFAVLRSTDGSIFRQINTVAADVTSYVNGKLVTGQHYWYRVFAFNKHGDSKTTKTAEGIPTPQTSTPPPTNPDLTAPSVLKVTASSSSAVSMVWVDNSNNETGFAVERSFDGVNFKQINTVGPNVTTYTNGKLTTGTLYWFRVRAFNTDGYSRYSHTAEGRPRPSGVVNPPPPQQLPAPGNFTATATDATTVTLNWSDITGETGYKVERSTDNKTFTQIGQVNADITTYPDVALTTGTTYYYRIRAFDASSDGDYTAVANATPTAPPLAAPDQIQTIALSESAIRINWADNSSAETGYQIQRSTDQKNFVLAGTVATDIRTFIDSGLQASKKYYYRVRAVNDSGQSPWSNIVSRTTKSSSGANDHSWANGGVGDYATGNWYFDGVTVTLAADPAQTIPILKALHIGSVRTFFSKAASWDPTVSNGDDGLANAQAYKAAGFRVMMVVGDDTVPTYDQAKAFFDYVGAKPGLMQAVDLFEIGNEPNQPNFWKGNAQQYVDVNLKPAWDALHPLGATIVGAGPTWDVNYAKTLVADGYLNYCDIADFHPYGSSPEEVLSRAQGAIQAYQGKPTLFSEWNIRNTSGLASWAAKVDAARKLLATVGADSAFYFTAFVANTLGGAGGLINLADFSPNEPFYDTIQNWGQDTLVTG